MSAKDEFLDECLQLNSRGPSLSPELWASYCFWTLGTTLTDAGLGDQRAFQFAPEKEDAGPTGLGFAELEERLTAICDQTPELEDNVLSVPRISAELFASFGDTTEILKTCVPIVVQGLGKIAKSAGKWTPEYFIENFGHFECTLNDLTTDEDYKGTLAEALQTLPNGKPRPSYAHNINDIFTAFPELYAETEIEKIRAALGLPKGRILGTQLFFGGSNTHTPYHAAPPTNIFCNIFGDKEWGFIHPKHSPWLMGRIHQSGMYNMLGPGRRHGSKRVPNYRILMKPGDVLVNPAWWWHEVISRTPSAISTSTRYETDLLKDPAPAFSFIQPLVPHMSELGKQIKQEEDFRYTDKNHRESLSKKRR